MIEIAQEVNDELEGLHDSNPNLTKKELMHMYTMVRYFTVRQSFFDFLLLFETQRLCGFRLDPQDKINCLLMMTNAHFYPSALK